jgi:hypothetical protein
MKRLKKAKKELTRAKKLEAKKTLSKVPYMQYKMTNVS